MAKMFWREILDQHAPVEVERDRRSMGRSRRRKVRQVLTRRPIARA